jgi:hypothetical protein
MGICFIDSDCLRKKEDFETESILNLFTDFPSSTSKVPIPKAKGKIKLNSSNLSKAYNYVWHEIHV